MMRRVRKTTQNILAALFTRETGAALAFVITLVIFETLVLKVSLDSYVTKLEQGEYAVGLAGFLVVFVSWAWAVLFFRVSFTSKCGVKIFCFVLLVAAAFFEYGYQNAFARFSSVEDLRIALFDATAEQRRSSILVYFDWRAAIPCAAYAILLFKFRSSQRHSWKMLGIVLLCLACFFAFLSPYTSGQFPTISLNAFLRTATLSPWKWASGYHGPRESVNIHADHRPQNNIILVIDESVRADHLSINGYHRPTTPYLVELIEQHRLYNWGIAASGGTCSEKSDSLLFTGTTLEELPDTTFQIRRRPNIFQYAKAMGYKTHFLDGQKGTYWLGTSSDKQYLDEWQPPSSFIVPDAFDVDAEMARKISSIVNGSTGHFILVIKRGVHYPYRTSFPVTAGLEWQPIDTAETLPDPASREQLINTYDDAIKYNLESFFRSLDVLRWANHNLLVYTSDHGQTLSEHGERYTHCGTSLETAPTEANVPLLIISSAPLAADTSFRASHANIFATLLDLMNVPKPDRRRQYAISLLEARATDSKPRYFWVGDLYERAFNGRILFDR
jgi:glucan phosphoethanolaminetransferase (alkaline phosphatase superfamily)